jgi:spermidine synthase
MIPRELIDTAAIPGGDTELRLIRHGADYIIMIGRNELMNSRMSGSEKALATLTCARLRGPAPRLLIGGLGMGFTLRAALEVLGARATVTVAELVPAVVQWARGPMAAFHGQSLDDARVTIVEGDVGALIRSGRGDYDAILLDVDNGPDGLTRRSNDVLYGRDGLAAARLSLRPGGVLAVWSSAPDAKFTRRLGAAGFDVEEEVVRAHGEKGARHTIWLATRG